MYFFQMATFQKRCICIYTPPHPTPPPAKMIKCTRSDAMKYESDSEFMDKVIKTNPAS